MTSFDGFRRPDGRVGIRNRLLVVPGVVCSAHVAVRIASTLPGAVALPHQHGCSQAGYDVAETARLLEGMACNPNVGAALVVSLGCEGIDGAALTERIAARSGKPVAHAHIQQMGGSVATISNGIEQGWELLSAAEAAPVVGGDLSRLVVGVRLGQPDDSFPTLSAAIDEACAAVLAAGGTVIRTTPGGDLGFGVRPAAAGEHLMDAPAEHEIEALTGLAAAGAHVILYGTGLGTPVGNAVVPVVKVTASAQALADWGDHIDVNLVDGASVLDALLAVARGQETAAELLGHDEFAIRRIGLAL